MLAPTSRTLLALLSTTAIAAAQWLQKAPATSPSARWGAAMAFDINSAGVVLFGGNAPLINGETWLYDGTTWTQLAPATSPTARFGAQLVHDSARGVAVLYGGLASPISVPPPNSDTWEWNGSTWTQVATAANAGPRYQYGMCFDAVRARTVLFGGANTQQLAPPLSTTWEYQGTTWTQVTTAGTPGPRNRPAMCFHAGLGKTVLFGGHTGTAFSDTTWLYDGTAWTQVTIPGSRPSPRSSASMTYDPLRNLCVLMGGQDAVGPLADTWTFDGSSWTQQPVTTQAVRDHALAFLPLTNQVVKFGGFAAAPNTLSNQTWELGSGIQGRGCAGTNGVPTLVATAAPRLGQSFTLNLTQLEPTFNLAFLAFGLTPLPGIDLGPLLGMPGCAAYSTADLLLSLNGSAGAASFSWSPVTGTAGATFQCQALCFDPTVNGFGFTISNAVYATINN